MNILITGANGLIGYFLYSTFLGLGHNVIGIDDYSNSYKKDNRIIELKIFEGSLEVMNELCSGIDVIFHAACAPFEGFSNVAPVAVSTSVFVPSVVVATAAVNAGVSRIYNFSSMARYGNQECPFIESMDPRPCDPYGVAKVAAENMFNTMSDIYGFEVAHIIPHNVFGENVRWDDNRRGVINIFIAQALAGKPLTIHNDGMQKRSFSFVQDTFSFAEQLLDCQIINKEIFNIGPDGNSSYWTINQLADFIIKETNSKSEKQYIEKLNDVKEAKCSSDKIKERFEWETKTNIVDEIRKMISFLESNRDVLTNKCPDIGVEIIKKCPSNWL